MPYADVQRKRSYNVRWAASLDADGLTPRMREVLAVLTNEWQTVSEIELRVDGQRPTVTLCALLERGLVDHLWRNDYWRLARASNQDDAPASRQDG